MIYFLVVWSVLGCCGWCVGTALLQCFRAEAMTQTGDRLIAALWLGVLTLATLLLTLALVHPLSPWVGWGGIGGVALLCGLWPPVRREWRMLKAIATPQRIGVGMAIALLMALFMARQVTWIDTGFYHYPLIKWLREVGVVPGLALLWVQLGYISTWFALAAPLNPAILGGQGSAGLNGFVMVLAVGQGLIALRQGLSPHAKLSDWFLVLFSLLTLPILLLTPLLSSVVVSASPDIPLVILIGLVVWSVLAIAPAKAGLTLGSRLLPVVLSAGAVGVKLIALPLLLVSASIYLLTQGLQGGSLLALGAIALAMLLPVWTASVMLSGCPLYPSSLFCLALPWSRTTVEVQGMAAATRGWGVWFGTPPAGVNPYGWLFWQWFTTIHSSKLIVALVGLSLLAAAYVLWISRRVAHPPNGDGKPAVSARLSSSLTSPASPPGLSSEIVWVTIQAIVGIAFILSQAPLFRFGLGYVVLLPALAIALGIHRQQKRIQDVLLQFRWPHSRRIQSGLGLIGLALLGVMLLTGAGDRLLIPPRFSPVEVEQRQINDVLFWQPTNASVACWDTPLPCTADPTDNIYLRHPEQGIQGGFVRRQD